MPDDISTSLLQIGDQAIPLILRRHARARRITLRYHALTRQALVTLPRRTRIEQALRFAEQHKEWLAEQIRKAEHNVPFQEGSVIPLHGVPCAIRHAPGQRQVVRYEDATLHVSGAPEHLARRLRDWLKEQARQILAEKATLHAKSLNVVVKHVAVRDTRSRWGSCSADRRLSFSWRLIFAPPDVLDYLVCHEVAHLREMNHSPAFWKLVASLCPEWQKHKRWLTRHGNELYRYG